MAIVEYQSRPKKADGVEHWYTFSALSFEQAMKKAKLALGPGHNQVVHGHRQNGACRGHNPVHCVTLRCTGS